VSRLDRIDKRFDQKNMSGEQFLRDDGVARHDGLGNGRMLPGSVFVTAQFRNGDPTQPFKLIARLLDQGPRIDVARLIGQKMTTSMGQTVIVTNKTGTIGEDYVAKSPPDGYTLVLAASSHAINPTMFKLPYDTVKSFAPVAMTHSVPLIACAANPVLLRAGVIARMA
jgi:hypothetical protein